MSQFDVTEAILSDIDPSLDEVERLVTMWRIICDENESEAHLVTEEQWLSWASFESRINRSLSEATCDSERMLALRPLVSALSSEATPGTHAGHSGIRRDGVFHGRVSR